MHRSRVYEMQNQSDVHVTFVGLFFFVEFVSGAAKVEWFGRNFL